MVRALALRSGDLALTTGWICSCFFFYQKVIEVENSLAALKWKPQKLVPSGNFSPNSRRKNLFPQTSKDHQCAKWKSHNIFMLHGNSKRQAKRQMKKKWHSFNIKLWISNSQWQSIVKTLKFLGKDTMFCQEEINNVLGNHKGARDHLVSKVTMNEECYIARRF